MEVEFRGSTSDSGARMQSFEWQKESYEGRYRSLLVLKVRYIFLVSLPNRVSHAQYSLAWR
jgi:hypothetical protein